MLVDSHCHLDHLDLTPFDDSLHAALEAAREQDVLRFLTVAINMANAPHMITIAEEHPDVYASVGVHPNEQGEDEPSAEELLRLADHKKVIAIGETGLDYYRSEGELSWQRQRFRTHIGVARESKKPLIIHSREARADTLRILREERADEAQGVMHCFVEDLDTAKAAMDLGFYISFSGIVSFKNSAELRDVARHIPINRLLVETDSPYLAPVPYRGKPNQPAYVRRVAETLAEERGESFEALAASTTSNFNNLFKLPG